MVRSRSFYLSLMLAAAVFVFIQTFPLLSPILLSLLLTLAVNPVISRMRAWTGGRKVATALMAGMLVIVMALTGWAFFGPMKTSVTKLAEQLPTDWERLQNARPALCPFFTD